MRAQTLDDTWTLSINGQSARVDADGSFRIKDIVVPDDYGPGGQGSPRDGLSDDLFPLVGFSLTSQGFQYLKSKRPLQLSASSPLVLTAQDVEFLAEPPILPERIRIGKPQSSLTAIGQTMQLWTNADYTDGTESDITGAAAYTTYRSSNPNIASVDANGMVTGRASGRVFITAVNNGVSSSTELLIDLRPTTTVEGFIYAGIAGALSGVRIMVDGRMAETDQEGYFQILEVLFDARIVVRIEADGFQPELVNSDGIDGGITDVGIVRLRETNDERGLSLTVYDLRNTDFREAVGSGFSNLNPVPFDFTTSEGTMRLTEAILPEVNALDSSFNEFFLFAGANGVVDSGFEIRGDDIQIAPSIGGDYFGVKLEGFLLIPEDGNYIFEVGVDDAVEWLVDGVSIVQFLGLTDFAVFSKEVTLTQGWKPCVVYYGEATGDANLVLSATGPGYPGGVIPSRFFRPASNVGGGNEAIVSGRVVNALGQPLADVEVSCRGTSVTTAADGGFRLLGVPAGDRAVRCQAIVDGAFGLSEAFVLNGGDTVTIGDVTVRPHRAGLQHRYPFVSASGKIVRDVVAGQDGRIKGIGEFWTSNGLRLLGGSSDSAAYVDLPNGLLEGMRDVTFEVWFTPYFPEGSWSRVFDFGSWTIDGGASSTEQQGLGGFGTGYSYIALSSASDGVINYHSVLSYLRGIPAVDLFVDMPTPYAAEYHAVITYDSVRNEWSSYRNGLIEGSVALDIPYSLSAIEDVNNWLGRSNWYWDANTNGQYRELRIYDRTLSPIEIVESYFHGPNDDQSLPEGTTFLVTANSNLFGARSLFTLPQPGGGGAGVKPPKVSIPAGAKQMQVQVQLAQIKYGAPPYEWNNAEGFAQPVDLRSAEGISGILADRAAVLAAVFIGSSAGNSAPPRLDFRNRALGDNFTTLSPRIRQSFHIGDGLSSSGIRQNFEIPAGATDVALGFLDGYFSGTVDPGWYDDNEGAVHVAITFQ